MDTPAYIIPTVVINAFCLINTAIYAYFIGKSEFIDRRAPFVSVIGTLAGLVNFNTLFQASRLLYPESYHHAPYLLQVMIRYNFETLWLFSYLVRAVYLAIAAHVNGSLMDDKKKENLSRTNTVKSDTLPRNDTTKSTQHARSMSQRSQAVISLPTFKLSPFWLSVFMRFLWAKKIDGKFVLGNSMYSISRLSLVMGTFLATQVVISVTGMLLSNNNFLADMSMPAEKASNDNIIPMIVVYILMIISFAFLLFLLRKGI